MTAGDERSGDANARAELTRLLQLAGQESPQDLERLWSLIYDELHAMASARLASERRDHTLQPTALVHEAYLKLVANEEQRWENRLHFFGAAARAMRQILIDAARRHRAAKRGAARPRLELSPELAWISDPSVDLIALEDAISELERRFPRQAQVVQLRVFAGLSIDETALALELSEPTVVRDWRFARAWLKRAIDAPTEEGER